MSTFTVRAYLKRASESLDEGKSWLIRSSGFILTLLGVLRFYEMDALGAVGRKDNQPLLWDISTRFKFSFDILRERCLPPVKTLLLPSSRRVSSVRQGLTASRSESHAIWALRWKNLSHHSKCSFFFDSLSLRRQRQ